MIDTRGNIQIAKTPKAYQEIFSWVHFRFQFQSGQRNLKYLGYLFIDLVSWTEFQPRMKFSLVISPFDGVFDLICKYQKVTN